MNRRLEAISARRRRLVAEIAGQRHSLRVAIEPWRKPLARLDQGLVLLRLVRRHPLLLAATTGLLLLALRPGGDRPLVWLRRGWVAWQLVKIKAGS